MKDRQYPVTLSFSGSASPYPNWGSSMTSLCLIIWSYSRTGSAMSVSLMTFCTWLPYIAASIVAGPVIDRYRKKTIMLLADLLGALLSDRSALAVSGNLAVWHFIVNGITGFMNAFQFPAETVAVGILVPKEKYSQASGLNSFTSSLTHCGDPGDGRIFILICRVKGVIALIWRPFVCLFCPAVSD